MSKSKRPTTKLQPIALYWLDPAGDPKDNDLVPVPSVTLGFLVFENKDYVRIASEMSPDAIGPSDFTVVPRSNIIAVKRFPLIHRPEDVLQEAQRQESLKSEAH